MFKTKDVGDQSPNAVMAYGPGGLFNTPGLGLNRKVGKSKKKTGIKVGVKGSASSGDFDHGGRPGEIGGSESGDGGGGDDGESHSPGDGPKITSFLQATSKTPGIARDAAKVINSVHSLDDMPKVPVVATGGKQTLGYYKQTVDGRPVEIGLSKASSEDDQKLFAVHEMGHYIEGAGMEGGARNGAKEFAPFMKAVQASPEHAEWKSGKLSGAPAGASVAKYAEYLTQPHEIWARAYSQYIATRSGDIAMKGAVDRLNKIGSVSGMWSHKSFKPIGKAIDDMFAKRGWIK